MKRMLFFVAAASISSSLLAQQAPPPSATAGPDSLVRKNDALESVTVTAGKYPRKQSETGKVVEVISRRQLEENPGKTLSEILQMVPGLTINGANNTLGSLQVVNLRGSAAGNTLILVDGVPVNDPSATANYFDLNLLLASQVERIEVLKGGQSTLYGSDAVAGVINIILKKAPDRPLAGEVDLSAGSYGTANASASLAGSRKKIDYRLQYAGVHSDGFSSAYDSTGKSAFERDGYRQQAWTARLGYRLSPYWRAEVSGTYSRYRSDLDAAAFTDDKDYTSGDRNRQAGAALSYRKGSFRLQADYQYNNLLRTYLNDSFDRSDPSFYYSRSRYAAQTHYAEVYAGWSSHRFDWLAGVDFRKHSASLDYFSVSLYGPYESGLGDSLAHVSQISPYASVAYKPNARMGIEAGGRWNHHSVYGSNATYTLNPYAWLLPNRVKAFVNLYSAYKTPTLYQLFDPYAGNRDLQPERSAVWEAGVQWLSGMHFQARAVYFHRRSTHTIEYIITDPNTYSAAYSNISRVMNEGLELELSEQIGRWQLAAQYCYTKGQTQSPYDPSGNKLARDTVYNSLYRVPEHAFQLSAGWRPGKSWYAGLLLRGVGKRLEPVYGATPVTLAGYVTIDLQTTYRLDAHWKCFLSLQNLTNRQYFDYLGYNNRRFNGSGGLQYSF